MFIGVALNAETMGRGHIGFIGKNMDCELGRKEDLNEETESFGCHATNARV